jgi:hypothetical protein
MRSIAAHCRFSISARGRARVGARDEAERVVRQLLQHDALGPDLQPAVIGNFHGGDPVRVPRGTRTAIGPAAALPGRSTMDGTPCARLL